MLITNFWLKYLGYKVICGIYQAADIGRIHPARERSLRALRRSVDYLERNMPDALGFDSQRELIEYSLAGVTVDGHYLEFGVFTGGTIRFIARRIGQRLIHGFDSFKGYRRSGRALTSGAARSTSKGTCRGCRKTCAFIPAISKKACRHGYATIKVKWPLFTSTATYTVPPRRFSR